MSSMEDCRRQKTLAFCTVQLLKIMLVVTNLLVLILEIILAGIFFYLTRVDKSLLVNGLGERVYNISFGIVCVCSVFVILFTIFGLVGVARENRCLLTIHFSFMFAVLLGEVAAVALTANRIESVRGLIKYNLYNSLRLYNSSVTITNAWDLFQRENKCCGMGNPESKNGDLPMNSYKMAKALADKIVVPSSCCVDSVHRNVCMRGDQDYIYNQDCFEVLKALLSKHHAIILGVGISCLSITVVTLFLTGTFIVLT